LGIQPYQALGTVIAGPVNLDGYVWWQINYDEGVDGWSIEYIGNNINIRPIEGCVHQSDTDCDGCVRQDEIIKYITKWRTGDSTLAQLIEAIKIWKQGC